MRKLFLLLNATLMATMANADVNYRYYEKNTENGGANGYSSVKETTGTIWVTLGTVERKCRYYGLDCNDPGNTACVFSVPPSHFYMPTVDQEVANKINLGFFAGQIYLDQTSGPGDGNNVISPVDMPSFLWAKNGDVTKIVVLDQVEE